MNNHHLKKSLRTQSAFCIDASLSPLARNRFAILHCRFALAFDSRLLRNSALTLRSRLWLAIASQFCILLLASCSNDNGGGEAPDIITPVKTNANANPTGIHKEYGRLEMPRIKGGTSLPIIHRGVLNEPKDASRPAAYGVYEEGVNYISEWDYNINAQRWSCYQMYKNLCFTNTARYYSNENQYPNDEDLSKQYHFSQDPYRGSGFQHGHICPSADRVGAFAANYQTFFMTNMQPQYGAFNGYSGNNEGLWLRMEGKMRQFVTKSSPDTDTLYVCKGGTIDKDSQIIKYIGSGNDQVPVPKYFFMAFVMKSSNGYKGIAFWSEQDNSYHMDQTLASHMISIDKLEELTGIDFFCNLPDKVEDAVEKMCKPEDWNIN